jgi:hypothetical protein
MGREQGRLRPTLHARHTTSWRPHGELGEVAELINNDGILGDRPRLDVVNDMYGELIQVAAVAIAWCEGLSIELECADAAQRSA